MIRFEIGSQHSRDVTMDDEPEEIILPAEIARFFRSPALLATETFWEYDSLFRGIALNIDPKNNLEWLALRNYLDCQWQIRRVQIAISSIINAAHRPALRVILESILPETQDRLENAARMTCEWCEHPDGRGPILELLRKHGFDETSIGVRAMEMHAVELDRLDVQMQRQKLAATRHLKELQAIRRCSFWRSTEEVGRGVKPGHPRANGNRSPAGGLR
jgi:hypothetical protein